MYIKSISEFITDTEQVDNHLRGGVVQILSDETKHDCEICLEAGYKSDERADVVIVGKRENRTVVIIIENKQWSQLNEYVGLILSPDIEYDVLLYAKK